MSNRTSPESREYHSKIAWPSWRRPRDIERLDDRAYEVLQALRAAEIDDYISGKIISEIIAIESGRKFASNAGNIVRALQNYRGAIEKHIDGNSLLFRAMTTDVAIKPDPKVNTEIDPKLVAICDRFHRAGSHVAKRRQGKQPIDFSDEYDLQDVFGLVLKCAYESVKDEEWTPSYGGSAGRIDYIVEDTQTAAELKLARLNHKVGDELLVDIGRYRSRADVRTLVCFVYDPMGHLRRDASEIEKSLSGRHAQDDSSIAVRVIIRPH
jgi:hypothetical protein